MRAYRRNKVSRSWGSADFDSFEVLVACGVQRPAALVRRARAPHPLRRVRRTLRSALRTVRQTGKSASLVTATVLEAAPDISEAPPAVSPTPGTQAPHHPVA
jgi:hypothetical protein